MTAFGDFLAPARGHIIAAVAYTGDLPGSAATGVIHELARLTPALARYLQVTPIPDNPRAVAWPAVKHLRAVIDARSALRQATVALREGAMSVPHPGPDEAHPAARHLAAAADFLAAGADLLHTHFGEDAYGRPAPASYWAPVLASPSVTAGLLGEIADCARQLAPWTAALSVSGPLDGPVPPAASAALHTASRLLWTAGASIEAAQRHQPTQPETLRLLAAVPVNLPAPRLPPTQEESLPELCEQAIRTSERLRQAAWSFARQATWSPAATSQSWRRAAFTAAITGHSSESILRTLARRSTDLGLDPETLGQLQAAAKAVRDAWQARRDLAGSWEHISTGAHDPKIVSPVTAELADLVLRTGRIAYRNPRWTPASGSGIPRDPADLAPGQPGAATVVAAVHHTLDALARIAVEDCEAVRAAAADHRLYLPTRRVPTGYTNMSRRYRPIPRPRADALLESYAKVIRADASALTALDTLATKLNTSSAVLGTARAVPGAPGRLPRERGPSRHAARDAAKDQPDAFRTASTELHLARRGQSPLPPAVQAADLDTTHARSQMCGR